MSNGGNKRNRKGDAKCLKALLLEIAKSKVNKPVKSRNLPKICRKPRQTSIVTPASTKMSIYHCPYSLTLEK